MSVPVLVAVEKRPMAVQRKHQRFHQASSEERAQAIPTVNLLTEQKVMEQLLSADILKHLALKCNAADERQRKLTCSVFFWLAVLAFGPGGPATLQSLLTYSLTAALLAGFSSLPANLSKEALSENFRERPWQFFAAVLDYLLTAYGQVWQVLAGQPNPLVVEQLRVLLVDTTSMQVATKLFGLFPGRATGKRKHWAGVKLHLGWQLFKSVPEVLAITAEKKNGLKIDFLRPTGEAALYIFDLGYWAYHLFDSIMDRQQHFLSRLRGEANPPILAVTVGDPSWVAHRLKEIKLMGTAVDLVVRLRGAHPTHPQMHHDVRLFGQWVERDQVWHLYVTSLLDSTVYPIDCLVDLYRLRWQIEILFRNLKCVLRIENFVSTTENGIYLQIYAALIHYVLTHLVILKAMQETGRPFEDFSLPYCLNVVQQVLQRTTQLVIKGQRPDWDKLEVWLIKIITLKGLRPNRKRPRLISGVKAKLHPAMSLAPQLP